MQSENLDQLKGPSKLQNTADEVVGKVKAY